MFWHYTQLLILNIVTRVLFPSLNNLLLIVTSLVPNSKNNCVKLSLLTLPCNAIPCLAKYIAQRMTSIKYPRARSLESTRFLLVISSTSLHFGMTWYAAAALWQFDAWWSSKHLGAFFQDLKPLLMYATSLFRSLSNVPFSFCVKQ